MSCRLPLPVILVALMAILGPSPAPAQSNARTVEIQASDTMRFTPARIEARAGEPLHIVLKDVGTMSKAVMAHNFVLLKRGADPKAFADKSAAARDTGFIATALLDQLIAATTLVGPGETAEVRFAAPQRPGEYTFICSFPGHFGVGMRGTLVVK